MAINNVNVAYTMERDVITLFGSLVIAASGAVSSVKGGGFKNVVKLTDDGNYEVEFADSFNRFLGGNISTISNNSTGSGVAKVETHMDPLTLQAVVLSTLKLQVQCYDFTGAKVNPVSGSVIVFQVNVRRSSIEAWD